MHRSTCKRSLIGVTKRRIRFDSLRLIKKQGNRAGDMGKSGNEPSVSKKNAPSGCRGVQIGTNWEGP